MSKRILGSLIFLTLLISACSGNESQSASAPEPQVASREVMEESSAGFADTTVSDFEQPPSESNVSQGQQQGETPALQERIILKNATLTMQVDDPAQVGERITRMIEDVGGWVVNSNFNTFTDTKGEEASRGTLTVRVPADQLDAILSSIKDGGGKVISENVTGDDVTAEFVDLSSQLENLQAAEDQLQKIMEDAQRTEDVLTVYNQLVNTRGQIEVIQGRLQYFREAAAFSSISINLYPPDIPIEEEEEKWTPGDTVDDAFSALVSGLQFAADVLIYVVICLLPILVVGALPAWFVLRRLRSNRNRKEV